MRRILVLVAIAVVVTGCSVERNAPPGQRDARRAPEPSVRFQSAPPVTSNAPSQSL